VATFQGSFNSRAEIDMSIINNTFVFSMEVCKACIMLEGLNKGKPKLGIGKSSKVAHHMKSQEKILDF